VRDIPTKPGEVANAVDADDDDVGGYYRRILKAIPFTVEPENPTDWVRRLCDAVDADDTFESAAIDLADDAVDAGLHVGKSTSGFAAAVVYATSKHRDAGIEQDDVAQTASVSPTTVRNQYRDVLALREDAVEPGDPDAIHAAITDLCDRIDGLPSGVRADAIEVATAAVDGDAGYIRRTDPAGVAAGIVYVAAKDARVDVSQTEVADVAGVSKSTVVNRVNDVRRFRKRLRFDGVGYNDLKALAADAGLDVGQAPGRDYLIDRLVAAGVEP
jgi:transcription initiation factor TFIIIB Brf1 subunit/transcription initiation factor TFIIB